MALKSLTYPVTLKKKSPKKAEFQKDATKAAVLEERRRIYRELHDRVLQLLSSVRLRAEVCRRELRDQPQALEKELETIEETTEKAITEIRRLLADTERQADLVTGTLERRLREELAIFRARAGLKLEFECDIKAHTLPREIERELYFALREGLINVIRHARASELKLNLSQEGNTCTAIVQDNGAGFDLAATEGSSHYGLRIMKERIENLGGQFTIDTAPGKGTRISIVIPLNKRKS
jgi:NarL family two-component system sensor histidine kinase LiaS